MEYSQIILEMLERIKILESKVQSLEEQNNMKSTDNSTQMEKRQLEKVSIKYRKLTEYLLSSDEMRISLSYKQIEDILGFSLPQSARNHPQQFWANTATHSYASSWMAIGYRTQVNIEKDEVTFYKKVI